MVTIEKISTLKSLFLKKYKKNYSWLTVCLLLRLLLISIIRGKLQSFKSEL